MVWKSKEARNAYQVAYRRDNLRLLCPNCHGLTETHAAANYGKSKRRRKWAGTVVIERPAVATPARFELATSASGGQRSVR